jgi:hypothetical protein
LPRGTWRLCAQGQKYTTVAESPQLLCPVTRRRKRRSHTVVDAFSVVTSYAVGFFCGYLHLPPPLRPWIDFSSVTAVIERRGLPLTHPDPPLRLPTGGRMKDIHEVLRQKQAKYAQLGKQIEMLQQAAEKLREVAPLLAENDDEDNAVLADDASGQDDAMAAKAGASSGSASSKAARPTAPRWP